MLRYFIFFLVFIAGCSGCKESGCPDRLVYEIPTQLYPAKDSIFIGDTLWLECSFSDKMLDMSGKVENNFIDYEFQTIFSPLKTDTTPINSLVTGNFSILNEKGFLSESITSTNSFFVVSFDYTNHQYQLKTGLIAKVKGTFTLFIGALEFRDHNLKAQDNCTKSNLDLVFNVNQHQGNHFEMIANCPDEFIKRYYTLEQFNLEGGYCFVVK